jgi:hypothetical protein
MAADQEPAVRDRGGWIGLTVGVFGLALTVLVLARGGGYYVVVPRLAFAVPLAVVGAVSALAAISAGRAALNAVVWLGVIALAGLGWNFLVYWFKFGRLVWGWLLPLVSPTGIDFRDGLYSPARAFSTARSGWPPLTLLLGRPFTLVSFSTGYAIQVGVLVALAVVAAVLSAQLATRAACPSDMPGPGRTVGAPLIALVMGFWLMTSYGFMFAVERGNIDLYALVFCLLAVWLMIRLPGSAWPPAAALAVAVGLKLYPAILLVVIFWRYRRRALLPVVVTTLVVFLVGGPANLRSSFATLNSLQVDHGGLGLWNSSAASLAYLLRGNTSWAPSWIEYPLLVVPLSLWAITLLVLVRRGRSDRRIVLAAAACVPPMSIVPAISIDYRLVLCVFPLAVLAAVVATMRRHPGVVWTVLFGALAFCMIFLGRSSQLVAPSLQASKYTFLVLVQALLLIVVLMTDTQGREAAPAGSRGR